MRTSYRRQRTYESPRAFLRKLQETRRGQVSLDDLRDLVPSIRDQLELEPHQRMARCRFHDDRSSSLSVFEGRDGKTRWRCHACNIGGDALDLAARLEGLAVGDFIRELRGRKGISLAPRRKARKARQTRPQQPSLPRLNPRLRAEVAALWRASKACIRSRKGADVRAYLVTRLGKGGAAYALEAGLVGALPPGARWQGRRLRDTHRLVVPLFEAPRPGKEGEPVFPPSPGPLDPQVPDEPQPLDLVRRRFDQEHPRYLSLKGALNGATATFGDLADELVEADSSALVIVEGCLNAVAWKALNPGRGVIGLHGAASAPQVAFAVARELRLLHRDGVTGPPVILIDCDPDDAGRKARASIVETLAPAVQEGLELRDFVRPNGLDAADILRLQGPGGDA